MTQHQELSSPAASRLGGARALVVGASSGIGRATARALASAGAHVALAARRVDLLAALAAEIAGAGGKAGAVQLDVRDRASVEAGVAESVQQLGGLDLVVYATGTNLKERAIDVLPPAGWADLIETNLNGAFHVTQAVLPTLRAGGGGLLIYVSSMGAKKPDVSGVAYQASKHGLIGLAHGTMEEQRSNGIRTTVIFPGLTDTPLVLKRPTPTPPEVLARALQPEDVAEACLFVASLAPRAHVPELLLYPAQ